MNNTRTVFQSQKDIYKNVDTIIAVYFDEPITLPGNDEKHGKFIVKVSWSEDLDGKYLEEVKVLKDQINEVAWKEFPQDVWDQINPAVAKFLMQSGISFNKKKIEKV